MCFLYLFSVILVVSSDISMCLSVSIWWTCIICCWWSCDAIFISGKTMSPIFFFFFLTGKAVLPVVFCFLFFHLESCVVIFRIWQSWIFFFLLPFWQSCVAILFVSCITVTFPDTFKKSDIFFLHHSPAVLFNVAFISPPPPRVYFPLLRRHANPLANPKKLFPFWRVPKCRWTDACCLCVCFIAILLTSFIAPFFCMGCWKGHGGVLEGRVY